MEKQTLNNYIYMGNEFPSYKGEKVTVIKEYEDVIQVKVLNESAFVEGIGFWGIAFYCKREEVEVTD